MPAAPWPGEKLGLYDRVVLSGSLDWYALDVNESPDTLTTLTAGDSFYLYAESTASLLESDALGACDWLIDVASGSAAVTVATGYDAGWGYREPFGWAASGVAQLAPGLVRVPLPDADRSYGRLAVEGAPLLRITVTSGRVDVRAIWLQVEPPGGLKVPTGFVLSDWVTPPERVIPAQIFTRISQGSSTGTDPVIKSAICTYNGDFNQDGAIIGDIDVNPSYEALANSVLNTAKGLMNTTDWLPAAKLQVQASWGRVQIRSYNERQPWNEAGPGFDYNAQIEAVFFQETKAVWADIADVRSTVGLSGKPGRDYITDDSGPVVEYAGDSASVGWVPGYVLAYGASLEHHVNRIRGAEWESLPSPHGETFELTGTVGQKIAGDTLPANAVAGTEEGSLSWPQSRTSGAIYLEQLPGRDIVLTAKHNLLRLKEPASAPWGTADDRANDWVDDAQAWVLWGWTEFSVDHYGGALPSLRVQPPAFRYRIPVYDKPRKPRFYVTYTEVDEHPVDVSHVVGIGKPADDLSIFRVPTPLGTLRELRHGEKVSDVSVAYPLKVKLEDGSWTVVAGMTPDN